MATITILSFPYLCCHFLSSLISYNLLLLFIRFAPISSLQFFFPLIYPLLSIFLFSHFLSQFLFSSLICLPFLSPFLYSAPLCFPFLSSIYSSLRFFCSLIFSILPFRVGIVRVPFSKPFLAFWCGTKYLQTVPMFSSLLIKMHHWTYAFLVLQDQGKLTIFFTMKIFEKTKSLFIHTIKLKYNFIQNFWLFLHRINQQFRIYICLFFVEKTDNSFELNFLLKTQE